MGLGGEEGAKAGAALGLCRAEKGEGLGVRTPFPPPCSRPLGRAPLMGLGKEAAKAALGDCGAAWYSAVSAGGGRGRRDRKRYGSAWESKTDRAGDVFL